MWNVEKNNKLLQYELINSAWINKCKLFLDISFLRIKPFFYKAELSLALAAFIHQGQRIVMYELQPSKS